MTTVNIDKPLSAEEVARLMSPADRPDAISPEFVRRRMSSGRWPSVKLGHARYMLPGQYQEALDIESRSARKPPPAPASGVSSRSRAHLERKSA